MTRCAAQRRKAFSLTEVLLAIFIMGIGVIAIAALFPAGIAQQRRSVDDVIGPIVANNAVSVLRLKLDADDFGTFEDFGVAAPQRTIDGDWPWLRPGVARDGWYDVFSETVSSGSLASEFAAGYAGAAPALYGIPYNMGKWPAAPGRPPRVFITQGERYYPIVSDAVLAAPGAAPPAPQYVWDCMFRRYQGKILVAIFVYRVQLLGGGSVPYVVPPNYSNPAVPPLPINLDLIAASPDDAWDASDDPVLLGSPASAYDPRDQRLCWQEPRQWLLDQNNNIHCVLSLTPQADDDPNLVELVRPVAAVPAVPTNYVDRSPSVRQGIDNIVTNIWYVPVEVELDADGDLAPDGITAQLTPVYVTVREL
jgi:hypothetical protein